MDFDALLKSFELTDAQITAIRSEMAAQQIYLTKEENLSERYEKVRRQRDEARQQLKDIEINQAVLSDAENLREKLDALQRSTKLERLLVQAGVQETDMDYVLNYKLSGGRDLQLDELGNFEGIDHLLSDLSQQLPSYFSAKTLGDKGYQVIDRPLNEGIRETFDPFAEKMAKYQK